MRPQNLKTKIFLDGGDPNETRAVIDRLGFLDGQTTNPTLISRNPQAKERLARGHKFTEAELLSFYQKVIEEISHEIPQGSISIEVYADPSTTSDHMLIQAREMFTWIPNAHIKFPTNTEGLKAAEKAVAQGIRVNMTLCFSQLQAAAVYAATRSARRGQVFVSPFIGRLDDRGENGMDLIVNIMKMYREGDGHVEVLTASVRNMDHFLYAVKLGSDIITAPFKILMEWADQGMEMPPANYSYKSDDLKPIPYHNIDLDVPWQDFDIHHDLTVKGMQKFSEDWNALVK